jgi:hypothetical protein
MMQFSQQLLLPQSQQQHEPELLTDPEELLELELVERQQLQSG